MEGRRTPKKILKMDEDVDDAPLPQSQAVFPSSLLEVDLAVVRRSME